VTTSLAASACACAAASRHFAHARAMRRRSACAAISTAWARALRRSAAHAPQRRSTRARTHALWRGSGSGERREGREATTVGNVTSHFCLHSYTGTQAGSISDTATARVNRSAYLSTRRVDLNASRRLQVMHSHRGSQQGTGSRPVIGDGDCPFTAMRALGGGMLGPASEGAPQQ